MTVNYRVLLDPLAYQTTPHKERIATQKKKIRARNQFSKNHSFHTKKYLLININHSNVDVIISLSQIGNKIVIVEYIVMFQCSRYHYLHYLYIELSCAGIKINRSYNLCIYLENVI